MNIILIVLSSLILVISAATIWAILFNSWKFRPSKKGRVKSRLRWFNKKQIIDYQIELKIFANSLVNALSIMGNEKVGALIVVAQKDDLKAFENNGYQIQGSFSPEFTMSIFSNKKSALHDGAMIIDENFNIATVSAYIPMTKNIIDVKYGARHRAAVGMSEVTDALVFVVSETTGLISYAKNGSLSTLSKDNDLIRNTIFSLLGVKELEQES